MSDWRQRRRDPGVLSLVERGWFGARTCSLSLNAMTIPVTHLIKGHLDAEVRAMIRPYPHIRIISVPRICFRVGVWGLICWQTLTGRLQWLLIDHERTLREVAWWCRLFRLTPLLIHETDEGYQLEIRGQRRSFASVFGAGG